MGGCKAGFRNEGRTCLIQPPTYLLPPLYSIWNFRAGICKLLFLFTESSESQRLKLPVGLCQEARCEVPSAVWAGFVFTLVDFHVWELHTSTLTQQRFLVRRNGIPRSCQNWTEIAALLCNKGKRIQQATPEDLSPVLCNNNRNGESVKSWDSLPKLQLVFATKKGSKLGGYMRGRVALPFPYFLHCFPTHLLVTVGDRAPGQNYLWTEPVWDE
ncbi:uncharacterized protein LOC112971630 isoform X3 [Apteryx rowi]|uniref:uncharacterized protein LOC112971630 isoform X3 n=1 Tax=Apteryx rowi TaxID=308060 RepID=UPI000E1C5822|nr:uncharacterized protein LOC112971630 isoform X3 [Apteryx rowi]